VVPTEHMTWGEPQMRAFTKTRLRTRQRTSSLLLLLFFLGSVDSGERRSHGIISMLCSPGCRRLPPRCLSWRWCLSTAGASLNDHPFARTRCRGSPKCRGEVADGRSKHVFLQVLSSPAERAATSATSTVAPLVGHSTASWVASTGPAASTFVPSLSSSARDVGAMDPGPDSAPSAYVAVPGRPKAARHCRRCRSVLCPGRSRLMRCVSESGTAAADALRAARQALTSGSSSAPPSSPPDASGSTSSSAGEREPPPKTPKDRQ